MATRCARQADRTDEYSNHCVGGGCGTPTEENLRHGAKCAPTTGPVSGVPGVAPPGAAGGEAGKSGPEAGGAVAGGGGAAPGVADGGSRKPRREGLTIGDPSGWGLGGDCTATG